MSSRSPGKTRAASDQGSDWGFRVVRKRTDNQSPVWKSTAWQLDDAYENEPYTSSIADLAFDADEDPLNFTMESGPKWLSITSDGTLEGTPGSGDAGNKSIVFRVEDSRGHSQTLDVPYTIKVVPDPTIYVSPEGNDENPGSFELPFATITHAASTAQPGDQIKLRGGIYKERVHIDNIHGTEEEPIIISNYNDEKVVIEGAKDIANEWIPYEGNIWKTTVDFDVTQLFLDDSMLIGARWPNINKHWDEYDESDGDNPTPDSYWDLGTRSYANRTTKSMQS